MFGGIFQRLSLIAFVFSISCTFQPIASAESAICGSEVVNRLDLDAAPVLQKCLLRAEGEIALLPGRYYLRSTLDLGSKSNLTIKTAGHKQESPCLSAASSQCATLTASAENNSLEPLLRSENAKQLVFDHIALDGNIGTRRGKWGHDIWNGGGYNAKIHNCDHCRFEGFASVQAVQGTGLEFSGDFAIFNHTLFKDNGWDTLSRNTEQSMHWADGLTIWYSVGVKITHSQFVNNTDIDLILGSAAGAVIEENTFINNFSYAFGALMLDNFNGSYDGDFGGAVIRKNKIHCGQGLCGIGINVGPHLWCKSPPVRGALISENQIEGARQGILVNGAIGTEISANKITGPTPYANKSCITSPLAVSSGDQVNIHGNSSEAQPSQLVKCSPLELAQTVLASGGVAPEIAQLYREILARNPDREGGLSYTKALQRGESLKNIRRYMATSAENTSLLAILSDVILDMDLVESNRKAWQAFLIDGGSIARLRVMLLMSK